MAVQITITNAGTNISANLDINYTTDYISWIYLTTQSLVTLQAGYAFVAPVGALAYQIIDNGLCQVVLELDCIILHPSSCDTLGDAANFAVLGASTVTNTGTSEVNGNLGLSPGSSVTGFPPGVLNGIEYIGVGAAANAQVSAQAAYDCLSVLTPATLLDAELGGTTVYAGVYTFASSAQITGTLELNGGGDSNATFVFIIPTTLTTATSAIVSLTNSTQAGNIYWIVGTSATLGGSTTMVGNIIADQSITMVTSATLDGRAFALVAAVTMDTNVVTIQNCSINPCDTTTSTTTTTTLTPSTTTTTTTEYQGYGFVEPTYLHISPTGAYYYINLIYPDVYLALTSVDGDTWLSSTIDPTVFFYGYGLNYNVMTITVDANLGVERTNEVRVYDAGLNLFGIVTVVQGEAGVSTTTTTTEPTTTTTTTSP